VQTSQTLFSCGFGKGELAGKRSFFMSKTVSKFALTAGFALAMAFTFSCSGDDEGGGGTCSADFGAVTIGSQTWAARNLNCNVEGSKCYDNDPANCAKYGRLYDWATAMKLSSCNSISYSCSSEIQSKHRGICPSGWHIPSRDDWSILIDYVGGSSVAGSKLKSTSGWNSNGNGTDEFGFSALPGGYGWSDGSFSGVNNGGWWSTSEFSLLAYYQGIRYDEDRARWESYQKSNLLSVRCLKD
jgi:uncharacterized protein (TIGR02145 family)